MSNCYVRFLLVCCLVAMIPTISPAQSYAGTMPMDTLFICDYEIDLRVQNNGDEQLGAGDALNYIITPTENSRDTIYATSTDGVFPWTTLLNTLPFEESCCDEFFIYAVAGEANTNGFVNLDNSSIDFSDNALRLVLFGHSPEEMDNNDTTQNNNERRGTITAGGCDMLPIIGGCNRFNSTETLTSCEYECPCFDTLYLTGWDTISPTWYVLENDTVSARTSGDTIFTKLLLNTIPEDSMHLDTLVFDAIEESRTNLRVFNADPYINPNEYILINYRSGGIRARYNEPNKPILDTLILPTCCPIGGRGCGELSKPIRLIINYEENFIVGEYPQQQVFIAGARELCYDETTRLYAAGVNNAVSFRWSSGETTRDIEGYGGLYCVTVTDGNGCESEDCIDVIWYGMPSIDLAGFSECADDLSSYSLQIFTERENILSTNLGTIQGSYGFFTISDIPADIPVTITATNRLAGCETTRTIQSPDCSCPTITSPYSLGDIEICAGETIPALSVSSADVDRDSEIRWYDVATGGVTIATGLAFTPSQAGTYFVEVYNFIQNCSSARTSIRLTIYENPTVTITGDWAVCPGSYTELTANILGGEARSFQWSNGSTSSSVAVGSGDYSVTITDVNGCQDEAYATITEFAVTQASISGDATVCPDGITVLTASAGSSYAWSNFGTGSNVTVGTGTYMVTVTDANGCESVASETVTEDALPSIIILEECEQDEEGNGILVIQTEAANELPSSFPNVNSYVSGEYKIYRISGIVRYPITLVIVNPETGCINVREITPDCDCPPIAAPPASEIGICEGEGIPSITINIPEGLELCWYDVPVGGEPLFKNGFLELEEQVYYIAYRDIVTGCISPRSPFEVVINELPRIIITGTTATCGDESTEICANIEGGIAVDYQWSNGQNSLCSNLSIGTYMISIMNENGCENVAEVEITAAIPEERFQRETVCEKSEVRSETHIIQSVQGCDSLLLTTEYILEDNPEDCLRLYIPNAFSPNGDDRNDVFEIFFNTTIVEEMELHIFNRYGQEVFFTANKGKYWDGKYQNQELDSGLFTYILQIITTDENTYTYAGSLNLIR